uniref:phenylalanine--tRNA ligase n=1 Tax=Campylaephora sungminbooi TaxID=1896769 RepID=A0A1B0RRH9_9FLOR|nr:phenylalanyl-tRNA synthetase beta chain [Campylaephora sungminbooi]AKU47370.1 phenylalanyl-tRNA synthetase beta chain [Campylaephora sungminbooi]ALN11817.1 phenylalanyl-tRNA synthetase beta chain [Campylaephora sungminbooi]
MKFSWQNLNYFINLDHITIHQLTELLTIKGFEIDNIDKYTNINDYIFDIAITANRQDTLSVIGIATELSYILNKNIQNQYQILQYQINHNNIINQLNIQYISSIRINKIINLQTYLSPLWLINYLKIHDIKSSNLILDIKKYIKIKWGHDIHFFNIKDVQFSNKKHEHNYIHLQKKDLYETITYNNNTLIEIFENKTNINHELIYNKSSSSIIACSYIYSNKYLENIKNIYNTIDNMQGYYEALQLIATFGKGCISKSYSYTNNKNIKEYNLYIHKNLIQSTLGTTHNSKSQYLKKQIIDKTLKQLKLKPQYNYYNKHFKITIPRYRINDLCRKIDLIEEIGRIYGYQNFIDKIPYINKKGNISKQYQMIKYIRQYFRDIGLHEVINSSLNKSLLIQTRNNDRSHTINVYNPLLEDQSNLRYSLLDNILKNKIHNYKQKNNNIEIFEIGKVFIHDMKKNIQQEKIHLAGILSNTKFIKTSWKSKPSDLNWFHAKGILEQFFEKIQIGITWHPINKLNEKEQQYLSLSNFDIKNTICIRNAINYKIIGLLGIVNPNICKDIVNNETINIFELHLNHLIKYYHKKSHLSYIFNSYSIYPSVTRDISIKIYKHKPIKEVEDFIYNVNKSLIQNVEVFNQYKDVNNINKKCIGIRITYNGINKTLDQNDLQVIEQNIQFILQTYQSE